MIPLRDDVPTRRVPLVTVVLVAANVLVYTYEFFLWAGSGAGSAAGERMFAHFVHEFGLVPCRVSGACPGGLATRLAGAPPPLLTVFTSMFVHGGLFHLGGNMLYLWIFGKSVEDAMGRGRFLAFYLLCGAVAAATQYLSDRPSPVPMVGASGAVSGALGAYLVLHPHARIGMLVGFGFFWRVVPVPALVVLGFWIVVQLASSAFTFGGGEAGGVAFLAHVGGFVTGMVLLPLFGRPNRFGRRRY